jgi:hypothetical protein
MGDAEDDAYRETRARIFKIEQAINEFRESAEDLYDFFLECESIDGLSKEIGYQAANKMTFFIELAVKQLSILSITALTDADLPEEYQDNTLESLERSKENYEKTISYLQAVGGDKATELEGKLKGQYEKIHNDLAQEHSKLSQAG